MNPLGQPLQLKANFKRLGLLAVIGLILFLSFRSFLQPRHKRLKSLLHPISVKSKQSSLHVHLRLLSTTTRYRAMPTNRS